MSDLKKKLRPAISSITFTENFSPEEKFQNEVLRPIIKLQHDLILSHFEHHISQNKTVITGLNNEQLTEFLNKLFKTNVRLKTELRGLITALFTLEEYNEYLRVSSKLNRRITSMIQQRIESCYNCP